MSFEELAFFLVGAKPIDDQRPEYRRFRELVVDRKRTNCKELKSGEIDPNRISADSPIPFDIRDIWYEIHWWLNATFSEAHPEKQTKENVCLIKEGNCKILEPPQFKAYTVGSGAPYKSKQYQEFYNYEKKLISRLRDSSYDFLLKPGEFSGFKSGKDLHDLLNEWIGNDKRITILDLAGVPFNVLDISIGLITRFVFDSMFWGRSVAYTGRQRPLFIALEEAHTYLNNTNDNNYARKAVEKVFKEGRKFGMGSIVISQRPSEISETILAQVGTFFALRLTNSSDQSVVKSSAPDNMNSLIDLLPSLRTGEAIVVGEAIKIPTRIQIPLMSPRPTSDDPKLVESWTKTYGVKRDNYIEVINAQREQKLGDKHE